MFWDHLSARYCSAVSISLTAAADAIRRIAHSSAELELSARPLGTPPLADLEWHRTLVDKLVPQMTESPFLVVAVVGGTNIGKSLIFNHIVGETMSDSSATASGTKHPVLVVPDEFATRHSLDAVFRGFEMKKWERADAALEAAEDLLFWRSSSVMPENLTVLDTPDIDSDARVNWERADRIRRAADVLVCVLTNQKYNDAAVREFFRKAADEGQVVLVVFNQMQLPDDEPYWRDWLGTFCEETAVSPELVYLAPRDRNAAANLSLPFFPRSWPAVFGEENEPRSLLEDLSQLHFDEIKIRTLRGGLEQVAANVPDYLQLVRQRSGILQQVERRLVAQLDGGRQAGWPTLPNPLLQGAVKRWWSAQRTGWVKNVQNAYGALSDGIDSGVKGVRSLLGNVAAEPWEAYRQKEWSEGILATVEQLYVALESLQETGPEGVSQRAAETLKSVDRATLLRELKEAQEAVDLQSVLEEIVTAEMNRFKTEKATAHQILKRLDTFAAAARPAVTAGLFLVGAGPLVEVGVAGTALNLAADAAGGTAASVVGEKILGEGAGRAFSTLQDWFAGLHAKFIAARARWLREQLTERMLGDLPDEMAAAAAVGGSEAFKALQNANAELTELLKSATFNPPNS